MLDPLNAALAIAGSGLRAQSSRMQIVTENLANAGATDVPERLTTGIGGAAEPIPVANIAAGAVRGEIGSTNAVERISASTTGITVAGA